MRLTIGNVLVAIQSIFPEMKSYLGGKTLQEYCSEILVNPAITPRNPTIENSKPIHRGYGYAHFPTEAIARIFMGEFPDGKSRVEKILNDEVRKQIKEMEKSIINFDDESDDAYDKIFENEKELNTLMRKEYNILKAPFAKDVSFHFDNFNTDASIMSIVRQANKSTVFQITADWGYAKGLDKTVARHTQKTPTGLATLSRYEYNSASSDDVVENILICTHPPANLYPQVLNDIRKRAFQFSSHQSAGKKFEDLTKDDLPRVHYGRLPNNFTDGRFNQYDEKWRIFIEFESDQDYAAFAYYFFVPFRIAVEVTPGKFKNFDMKFEFVKKSALTNGQIPELRDF